MKQSKGIIKDVLDYFTIVEFGGKALLERTKFFSKSEMPY